MKNLTIVDYKVVNLGSIVRMAEFSGGQVEVVDTPAGILRAEKLILPGVGSFARAMKFLKDLNLIDVLKEKILIQKVPTLGICVGMQVMAEHGEEGDAQGLGLLPGFVRKFKFADASLKVPHMGWNELLPKRSHPLFNGLPERSRFYFVHSYFWDDAKSENVLATTNYGREFTAGVCTENLVGLQFHPEKSGRNGMKLMQNFIERL